MMERTGEGSTRTKFERIEEAEVVSEVDDALGEGTKTAGGVGGRSRRSEGGLAMEGRRGKKVREGEELVERLGEREIESGGERGIESREESWSTERGRKRDGRSRVAEDSRKVSDAPKKKSETRQGRGEGRGERRREHRESRMIYPDVSSFFIFSPI